MFQALTYLFKMNLINKLWILQHLAVFERYGICVFNRLKRILNLIFHFEHFCLFYCNIFRYHKYNHPILARLFETVKFCLFVPLKCVYNLFGFSLNSALFDQTDWIVVIFFTFKNLSILVVCIFSSFCCI